MKTLKRLLTILFGGIFGLVLLFLGGKEYFESKSLQSKGKSVVAEVTDLEERSGRRGRRKYYVSVNFKTEKGETITSRSRVSSSEFDEASASRKVNITYLPEKPSVHRIGPVGTEFGNIIFGLVVLGVAGFTAVSRGDGAEV